MLLMNKKLSPAIFALILICFFLPFVTVSCEKRVIVKLTGIQLAVGTNIEKPSLFIGEFDQEKFPPEPLATTAFICGFVGLATSFLKLKKKAIIPAIMGLIGAILLWLLKVKIAREALIKGEGFLGITYEFGFWLSFALFAIAAIFNTWIFFSKPPNKEI
ncbi:hypothetical protein G3T18_21010 [Oscillatoria salina IIICB1]|nr:hypothetical protein [Oscillatoria salina IIICB1]NET90599.1 hypothetical protein [Kamptonema sp. SIO1D9]